jgi:hypothetical protein
MRAIFSRSALPSRTFLGCFVYRFMAPMAKAVLASTSTLPNSARLINCNDVFSFFFMLVFFNKQGPDRQLGSGESQRLDCLLLTDACHFKQNSAGSYDCYIFKYVSFPAPHTGLGRLVGNRFIRKYPDPDSTAASRRVRKRPSCRFNLTTRYPTCSHGLETVFSEIHSGPADGYPRPLPSECFSMFCPSWC